MAGRKPLNGNHAHYAFLMAVAATLLGLSGNTLSFHNNSILPGSLLQASLLFVGTFLAYSLSALAPEINIHHRQLSFNRFNSPYVFLSTLVIITLLFAIHWPGTLLIQYSIAGILAVSYYSGISSSEINFKGARSVYLVKNMVLALAWSFATAPISLSEPDTVYLFANRFLYIMALSILIDIRDITPDKARNITTVPVKKGILKTKMMAVILLITGMAFMYKYSLLQPQHTHLLGATAAGTLCTILALFSLRAKTNYNTYVLLIDGNLLLHGVLFFLTSQIGNIHIL